MSLSGSFSELNKILEKQSYVESVAHATKKDYKQYEAISASDIDRERFPHLWRWHGHISALKAMFGNSDSRGHPLPDKERSPAASAEQKDTSKSSAKAAASEKKAGQKQQEQKGAVTDDRLAHLTHYCVLDFEKTCDSPEQVTPQEIIEFPSVLLSCESGDVIDSFQRYVKPTRNPTLTLFCTTEIGITQEQVDSGLSLKDAMASHHAWLRGAVPDPDTCIFVTCGNMDLKTSLPEDPNIDDEHVPGCYDRWLNIKEEFALFYNQWYPKRGKQPGNMLEMLEKLELLLIGRHHSGIDDCQNIAQVLQRMMRDGWRPMKLKERDRSQ